MHRFLILNNTILIPMYNLLIGIGTILGFLFLENQIKVRNIKFNTDRNIYFSIIISGFFVFLGAKFFELLYKQSNFNLQALLSSGITFYGGLIFGLISFFIINKLFKTDNNVAFNLVIPSLILFHGFGRIGCFFAGCCYGKPTDLFFGVTYPEGIIPTKYLGSSIKLHPVQLYEAFFLFLLFFIIVKFISFEMRTAAYFLIYSLSRFFIEFLRDDYRGKFLTENLFPSQTMSIIFFFIGVLLILKSKIISKMISIKIRIR